jgi:hypothetical protein
MPNLKIRFQGNEYLFIGTSLDEDGAIATAEDYAAGKCSYAHLMEDGRIMRFRQQIGIRSDIEVIGRDTTEITVEGQANTLFGSWPSSESGELKKFWEVLGPFR